MYMYSYTKTRAAEIVANWLKPDMKRNTILLWRDRKVYNRYGWHWTGSWAFVGADGEWHNFDKDRFLENLGLEDTGKGLAAILADAGYRVIDEGKALTVIFN